MDWQKELERSLSNAGAPESSLYEAHSSSGQHFGSSLPSLLQRQSSDRSAWPGYRGAHQWPAQMAWMSQHRAHSHVWGDPSFRQFFSDHSQDLHSGTSPNSPVFRSPWEPGHDVKTIENVLNSTASEQPVNYHNFSGGAESQVTGPGHFTESPGSDTGTTGTTGTPPPPPPPAPEAEESPEHGSQGSVRSVEQSQGEETEVNTSEQQGYSDSAHHPQTERREEERTHEDMQSYSSSQDQAAYQPLAQMYSPTAPAPTNLAMRDALYDKDNKMDDDLQDMPKDLTCDKLDSKNDDQHTNSQENSYDIVENVAVMKELDIEKKIDVTKTNKGATLDNTKNNSQNPCILEQSDESRSEFDEKESQQKESNKSNDIYDFDSSERRLEQKPIKLKIARGEVVKNTALECEKKPEVEMTHDKVKTQSKSWAINKDELISLNQKLETDQTLYMKVKDIVGECMFDIFANAVEEAETDTKDVVENKNIVFIYCAVKNSAYLEIGEEKKKEFDPLSNLALSIPLLDSLVTYFVKDNSMKEHIQFKIGEDNLEFFVSATKRAVQLNEEFWQDEETTEKLIFLYHSIRNQLLRQIFSKLTALYSKIEPILTSVDATEDREYNAAVAQMTSLVIAPWNKQVIEAERMKFDFEFLNQVFNFWKKVITKRNKPEKKPKKPMKMKPLPHIKPSSRSSRRRNEMVTYDEDIMQDCNLKISMNPC